ncbi:DNA invertase Pin-like site-specific DNA recombinase [Mycobacterium sp. MAA66]|uniref:recombinase family protein n=1 Tax=Mycobacterium sp. MAA66 TaxID=3156297 RepID=UPI003511835B
MTNRDRRDGQNMNRVDRQLVFAYSRVSTEEQVERRNGLDAQRAVIDLEANRRGWEVEYYADEGASGKCINEKLRDVLQLLASGQGDGLVVSKMDRLARSIINAADIVERANTQGWSLFVLDLGVDLTASGRLIAQVMSSFAEYERAQISERTKAALAAKRNRGERLGRPRVAQPGVACRIVMERNTGQTYERIAQALTAEGILSPLGRPTWQASTVRRIYMSATSV